MVQLLLIIIVATWVRGGCWPPPGYCPIAIAIYELRWEPAATHPIRNWPSCSITTSEIAISRVLRSVHCRLHTFFFLLFRYKLLRYVAFQVVIVFADVFWCFGDMFLMICWVFLLMICCFLKDRFPNQKDSRTNSTVFFFRFFLKKKSWNPKTVFF